METKFYNVIFNHTTDVVCVLKVEGEKVNDKKVSEAVKKYDHFFEQESVEDSVEMVSNRLENLGYRVTLIKSQDILI